MLRFEIELKIADKPQKYQVEELDSCPYADGFVRYRVHHSVISVNKSCWERPLIMTEADAWHYLEQLLYPAFPSVYSEDAVFSPDELENIRQQIGKYIMAL